jgi:hypothetical protein
VLIGVVFNERRPRGGNHDRIIILFVAVYPGLRVAPKSYARTCRAAPATGDATPVDAAAIATLDALLQI